MKRRKQRRVGGGEGLGREGGREGSGGGGLERVKELS